jgi:beta-phosphoglucomutase
MIKAVLFDLDGVIVDSLHFHYLAWNYMLGKIGGKISPEDVFLTEGMNSFQILPHLLAKYNLELPVDRHAHFIEEKRAYYRQTAALTYYPNAFETVAEIKKRGLATALVTACARKNLEKSVDTEKQKLFDFTISGDDVPRSKPFPDPYLIAQKTLGVKVEHCLVVENAPLGIESAKAAGMMCVAVESTLGREYLTEADFIINEIQELTNFFPLLRR